MPASNPHFWPPTIPLPLMSPAREYRPRAEIHRMESKRIRVRRYYPDFFTVYDFEWNFTQDEFDLFKTFFEDDLVNGSECFTIQFLDPFDSSQLSITDYGFFEAGYQFSYTNGFFKVTAVAVIEEEQVLVLSEALPANLCELTTDIWPDVSDGLGGGTTFECYDEKDYTGAIFDTAGTNIVAPIASGNSPFGFQGGEEFETFPEGNLFVGSPSSGSQLVTMFFGDSPFSFLIGEDFEDDAEGAYVDKSLPSETNLVASFSGNGI